MINGDKNNTSQTEVVDTVYGKFYTWQNDTITNQLKRYSAHARNELAMLLSFIRPGDNILDIGAHIGTYTIPIAKKVDQGTVFAIEGSPENYELLLRNISENGLKETIEPACHILGKQGEQYYMTRTKSHNTGSTHFIPGKGEKTFKISGFDILEWVTSKKQDLLINLIKIDIEGAEMTALKACDKMIHKERPILYIEIHKEALKRFDTSFEEIHHFLSSFGYHYFKNIGLRNSNNDSYSLARLKNLEQGGNFFDLLAILPDNPRYPSRYFGPSFLKFFNAYKTLKKIMGL
ncbi:MAG: FkbM family methyltransferase [Saprospiraceae bacterium]|nr:FkbM family methyltransferase [Saprospiraceae bacterium]